MAVRILNRRILLQVTSFDQGCVSNRRHFAQYPIDESIFGLTDDQQRVSGRSAGS